MFGSVLSLFLRFFLIPLCTFFPLYVLFLFICRIVSPYLFPTLAKLIVTPFGTKTALVTGGSGGIGFELSKLLVKSGFNVLIVARNEDKMERAKLDLEQIRDKLALRDKQWIAWRRADLSVREEVWQLWDGLREDGLKIDVLINNAAFGHLGRFVLTDPRGKDSIDMIQTNIASLVTLTRLFLEDAKDREEGGSILNVGSLSSVVPAPYYSVYAASKAFVGSFSRAISVEMGEYPNIHCTLATLGGVKSDFDSVAIPEGKLQNMRKFTRFLESDVAAAAIYKGFRKGLSEVVVGHDVWFMAKILPMVVPDWLAVRVSSWMSHTSTVVGKLKKSS